MNELGHGILGSTAWLYTRIYENGVFFFDLWSFAHLWSGFIIMTMLLAGRARRRWLFLTAALLSYELLELAFIYAAFHVFRAETLKDQVTDVLVGLAGGGVSVFLWTCYQRWTEVARTSFVRHLAAVLLAVSIAFEWVGNYGYRYDRESLNSDGLSWWALLLWSLGLLALAEGYAGFERRLRSSLLALLPTAALYYLALFSVEYLGYVTLGIHEVGHAGRSALAFDLIHGTGGLHVFYLSAPLLTSGSYVVLRRLFERAFSASPLQSPAARSQGRSLAGPAPLAGALRQGGAARRREI
jgi:hypothetical protein